MLAFIRGDDSVLHLEGQFVAPAEISMSSCCLAANLSNSPTTQTESWRPSFSPDNSRIAYSVIRRGTHGKCLFSGASLICCCPTLPPSHGSKEGKRLLFSEIKEGLHMAVVTTDEARGDSRDVYVPAGKRSMAHHSYLSPDGQWVLIVEMDSRGEILPCRIVPFQGTNEVRVVGPPNGPCLAGAWSPDGKWIYLTAKTDDFHIWRQRFPDGEPEQLTFGPTSQEGIAIAPDGKSLITSVGSQDHTVWLHDKDGDHQISFEGDASFAGVFFGRTQSLFPDGQWTDARRGAWVKDLAAEMDKVLPGYADATLTPFREMGNRLHSP